MKKCRWGYKKYKANGLEQGEKKKKKERAPGNLMLRSVLKEARRLQKSPFRNGMKGKLPWAETPPN